MGFGSVEKPQSDLASARPCSSSWTCGCSSVPHRRPWCFTCSISLCGPYSWSPILGLGVDIAPAVRTDAANTSMRALGIGPWEAGASSGRLKTTPPATAANMVAVAEDAAKAPRPMPLPQESWCWMSMSAPKLVASMSVSIRRLGAIALRGGVRGPSPRGELSSWLGEGRSVHLLWDRAGICLRTWRGTVSVPAEVGQRPR